MSDSGVNRGKEWLESLLKLSGVESAVDVADQRLENEGSCWLTIRSDSLTSEQITALIGERGAVLDAIQYLANTTLNLNQSEDDQCAYTVELNGYREQRRSELEAMAEEAMEHVRQTGEEYEISSLSAAERRQVHTLLQNFEEFETYSKGREPDRKLVVQLKSIQS
ncbi:MAG: R3H domain-containing nucleic acid-binding protein [Leptolyngbyaceae bacterium]|nr:R3H domain-containing nucleic acid-binding protein [Leptolyngbyaceae bacterium]